MGGAHGTADGALPPMLGCSRRSAGCVARATQSDFRSKSRAVDSGGGEAADGVNLVSRGAAGALQGLVDRPPDVIDVDVAEHHRVLPRPGIRVHRRRHFEQDRRAAATIPQTRVEVTVLDLVDGCDREEDVVAWVTRACQRRLTTPVRLDRALRERSRQRWRVLVLEVLGEVTDGTASSLERRFYQQVERPHGLPRSVRNARAVVAGTSTYSDARYEEFAVRIELESLAWHPQDLRWRDARRDNLAVLSGDVVLRYGWRAVVGAPCETAAEIASVLRRRGWTGHARPCGPTCAVRSVA